jgi:hypothetical protein
LEQLAQTLGRNNTSVFFFKSPEKIKPLENDEGPPPVDCRLTCFLKFL